LCLAFALSPNRTEGRGISLKSNIIKNPDHEKTLCFNNTNYKKENLKSEQAAVGM
jgi:hypothetical protein